MRKKRSVKYSIALLLLLLVSWTVWGNVTVGVTHYTVASHRLPEAFEHYRIAVVSDLHNAEFGKGNSRLIEQIEKEKPDLIAITGDIVDANRTDLEVAVGLVHRLTKIAPCYYVTGNHEAWLEKEIYQELEKKLLAEGVVIFHDSVMQLTRNGSAVQVAGLEDPDFTDRDSSIQESILRTKLGNMGLSDAYCILLSHRPETFEAYVAQGIDLVLCGHAHGGQFRLPFIGGIVAPNQGLFPEFDGGRYTKNNTVMVVSRGIGNSIIPVRFNNRPEIVVIDLAC